MYIISSIKSGPVTILYIMLMLIMYFVFVYTNRRTTHPQPNQSGPIMVLYACQIEFVVIHVQKNFIL